MQTKFVKIEVIVQEDNTLCSSECEYNDSGVYCSLYANRICIDGRDKGVGGNLRCEQCIKGEIL